jgi:hypothetical protein
LLSANRKIVALSNTKPLTTEGMPAPGKAVTIQGFLVAAVGMIQFYITATSTRQAKVVDYQCQLSNGCSPIFIPI